MASSSSSVPMELTSDQKSVLEKRKTPDSKEEAKDGPSSPKRARTESDLLLSGSPGTGKSGLLFGQPDAGIIQVSEEKVSHGFVLCGNIFPFQNITSIDLIFTKDHALFSVKHGAGKSNYMDMLHRDNSKVLRFYEKISVAFLEYQKSKRSCPVKIINNTIFGKKLIDMSDVLSVSWSKEITEAWGISHMYNLYIHQKTTNKLCVVNTGRFCEIIDEFKRLTTECNLIDMEDIKC